MLDISGTGARLELRKDDEVPNHFILLLSHNGQLRRQCSVVWRNKNTLGVHFVSDDEVSPHNIHGREE
jgi:hypothetical protein